MSVIKKRVYLALLKEMSRKTKVDFRKNYNHPGLVKHGLYSHWVYGGISETGMEKMIDRCASMDFVDGVNYFCNYSLDKFDKVLRAVDRGEELSCNLINPDKSVGLGTNYSGGGIDPWGYIGFIIRPRVVTAGYDTNIGVDLVDVGGGRMRKRERDLGVYGGDREGDVSKSVGRVKSSFPLEDEDAYLKVANPKNFVYGQSEFIVVPEEIVGVMFLDGEWSFEDVVYEAFNESDLRELGMTYEDLLEEKKKHEKYYLRDFCRSEGIRFYETEGVKLFDVPRTGLDL